MTTSSYAKIFASTAFPLLDRLNGTTICKKLEHLLASERCDPEEILSRQKAKLTRVMRLAEASKAFQALWQEKGQPGPPSEYPQLDGVPILTKRDFAQAKHLFPLPCHRGRVITSRTSGSTGHPMTFFRSLEQESWFWALRFRIWNWAGYRPGDRYLTINLNPREEWKKKLQDLLFRCSYLTYNADNQDSWRILDTLARHRIRHLNGFASSLYVLARYALDRDVPCTDLSGITSTGDTLFPTYREAIERAFGVRALDYYGAGGEGLHLASQCPESGGSYHLHPENAVVEVLGPEGPAPKGSQGRIVVTQLDNDAMPLVRYDLEDVGAAAADATSCSCGRTLPLFGRIEGRVPDLVWVSDGTCLVMHFFVVLFKNLQTVHRYQIVQVEKDLLLARLVPRPDCDKKDVEQIVAREITAATRGLLRTTFEWVDHIPLTGAGKRRLVISEIAREKLSEAQIPV